MPLSYFTLANTRHFYLPRQDLSVRVICSSAAIRYQNKKYADACGSGFATDPVSLQLT